MIKLTFISTFFHILNRKLPKGREVWPPGSHDITPFDYLKVPKREIFDGSDFPDFYTIKSLRVGDLGVKIK